jgi:hypothetical protein
MTSSMSLFRPPDAETTKQLTSSTSITRKEAVQGELEDRCPAVGRGNKKHLFLASARVYCPPLEISSLNWDTNTPNPGSASSKQSFWWMS